MISDALFTRFYPETTVDGTTAFYGWVRACVDRDSHVLNLGAGPPTGNPMRVLKGEVARVAGADIDPVVLDNPELDDAHVIENGELPFDDRAFSVVLSDFVLEHVEDPDKFLGEVHRVLRPGGAFLFRTPNRAHYVALISRLTPHWFHRLVANRVRGLPDDTHEPWKTFYRLNSPRDLRSALGAAGFRDVELRMVEAQPSYLVFNAAAFMVGVGYERLVNRFDSLSGFRATIFGKALR